MFKKFLSNPPLAFVKSPVFLYGASGFVVVQFLFFLFIYPYIAPDIDAFLYLGGRLDQGHLLYISEFETKLPIVQYLFWLPSKLGGIGAWRIISFILVTTIGYVAAQIFSEETPEPKPKKITFAYLAIFLLLNYSLPGSESAHISSLAAACLFLVMALAGSTASSKRGLRDISLGVFLAISVSIRPHYLYIVPILGILIWTQRASKEKRLSSLLFVIGGFTLVMILQFAPYLFSADKTKSLISALNAIRNYSHNISMTKLLALEFSQIPTVFYAIPTNRYFYIALYVMILLVALKFFKKQNSGSTRPREQHVRIFCVVSIILINLSFIRTHYWEHYGQLFSPFFSWCIVELAGEALTLRAAEVVNLLLLLSFLAVPVISVKNDLDILMKLKSPALIIHKKLMYPAMVNFIQNIKANGFSFYTPYAYDYHRLFNENRIGDGHVEMLLAIFNRKFKGNLPGLYLYSDEVKKNPCLAIDNSGKDFIILPTFKTAANPGVYECLNNSKEYVKTCESDARQLGFVEHFCRRNIGAIVYNRKDYKRLQKSR